jgi:hypothetical protein
LQPKTKFAASFVFFSPCVENFVHKTILPSERSLFTPVNRALRGHPSTISLSASGEVRAALLDLRQLVTTQCVWSGRRLVQWNKNLLQVLLASTFQQNLHSSYNIA